MAKLYFNYATMNAGKSTMLLQASYNYQERGMKTMLFTAAFDDRAGERHDRIPNRFEADWRIRLNQDSDLYADVKARLENKAASLHVFVDEAQFLV